MTVNNMYVFEAMYILEAVKVIKTSEFHLKVAETEKNGICLMAKRNMSFFETENHWPYSTNIKGA
jgi:hypothetical protein